MVDVGYHYSRDCNDNGVPDAQELADGTQEDCNYNGVPDECDILISDGGLCDPTLSLCSSDVEPQMGDGIPDECGEEPNPGAFTVNADFELGTLINVHHDDPYGDQLQRYEYSRPLPYLWVAASGHYRGSVLRFYTGDDPTIGQLGDVLGEYLTAPGTLYSRPSRTSVDLDGNAWVANRQDDHYDPQTQQDTGSIARVGLLIGGTRCEITGRPNPYGEYVKPPFKYNTCVDRDRDGLIHTSPPTTMLPEPLPWNGPRYGTRSTALDEAILNYVRVDPTGTRHVSVDANNDVWVGGWEGVNAHDFNLVDGVTGEIKPDKTFNYNDTGGYGGLIDCAGVIWSARGTLLRYDTNTNSGSVDHCTNSYGVGIDRDGNIWSTDNDYNRVCKLHADGTSYTGFPKSCGDSGPKGLAVTWDDNNVWIANCISGTVTRLDGNGNVCETITVGSYPTAVAVDSNGYVWVANRGSDSVSCIVPGTDPPAPCGSGTDPSFVLDEFYLGEVADPYNYSDMTGQVTLHTSATGTWNVVHDGGKFGAEWHLLRWNREAGCEAPPEDLVVAVRAADQWAGLTSEPYLLVEDGKRFNDVVGRYVEIRVRFRGSCPDTDPQTPFWTPVLCDLYAEWGIADMNCDGQLGFGDINPFVKALSNPAAYEAQYPRCDIMLGDINGDGIVGFGDINPFVALMAAHGVDVEF